MHEKISNDKQLESQDVEIRQQRITVLAAQQRIEIRRLRRPLEQGPFFKQRRVEEQGHTLKGITSVNHPTVCSQ